MVVKMVFLADHDPHRLVAILEDRQREYVRRLGKAQRLPRATPSAGVGARIRELARDAFRFREEGELRWIEHCLRQLRVLLRGNDGVAGATPSRAQTPTPRSGWPSSRAAHSTRRPPAASTSSSPSSLP